MRLSLLARKLDITPREMLLFLQSNKIGNYTSHNSRISDEHQKIVYERYRSQTKKNPESGVSRGKSKVEISENTNSGIKTIEATGNSAESQVTFLTGQPFAMTTSQNKTSAEITERDRIQIPKIKLKGIKVVGKINLPSVEKKSEFKEQSEKVISEKSTKGKDTLTVDKSVERKSDRFENRLRKKQKPSTRPTHNKGPELSYHEKLQVEERKKARARKEITQERKHRKTEHYLKNVKISTKKVMKNEKNNLKPDNDPGYTPPEISNPIRKFWAWLNGAYDKR